MNTEKLAAALENLGDSLIELARALKQPSPGGLKAADGEAGGPSPASSLNVHETGPEWLTPIDESESAVGIFGTGTVATADLTPQGSLSQCPKHRIPYKEGKYGPYCPGQSDEPNWSNDKGYCKITPKSASAWLRQHAGAPA